MYINIYIYIYITKEYNAIWHDSLAEWSKAPDSSSGGENRVGSNPTAVIYHS